MRQLALELAPGLFPVSCTEKTCVVLADRHYSRRTPGSPRFTYAGRQLVLRDSAGLVVFAWTWPRDEYRDDGRYGYHCALFRNESNRRSSEIILEAETYAVASWGPGQAWTFIDPRKVSSPNPGYCFKMAGWRSAGLTAGNRRPPKVVLSKWIG